MSNGVSKPETIGSANALHPLIQFAVQYLLRSPWDLVFTSQTKSSLTARCRGRVEASCHVSIHFSSLLHVYSLLNVAGFDYQARLAVAKEHLLDAISLS